MAITKENRRQTLRYRVRNKISGTVSRPRLSVFRSNKEIYAQLVDDVKGVTLVATSTKMLGEVKGSKIEQANLVGKSIAEKALAAGYDAVVFDRGGYLYHGRVKSLAEGAREGGLKF